MCSTLFTTLTPSLYSRSHQLNPLFNFPSHRTTTPFKRFPVTSSRRLQKPPFRSFNVYSLPTGKTVKTQLNSQLFCINEKTQEFKWVAKPLVYILMCVVLGLFPILGFQTPAIAAAAPVGADVIVKKKRGKKERENQYRHYTKRLLKTASSLLKAIENVKCGIQDVKTVEDGLKKVKRERKELQEEILKELYEEMGTLRKRKRKLMRKSGKTISSAMDAMWKVENLFKAETGASIGEGTNEKINLFEEKVKKGEEQYSSIWEGIYEIDDQIRKEEMKALGIGIRELMYIERECEILVEDLISKMKCQNMDSMPESPVSKLSRLESEKEMDTIQGQLREQMVLPSVQQNADTEHPYDEGSVGIAQRIKQALNNSKQMQRNVETLIRENMKTYGDEKRFTVNTTINEVVNGFPEIESKWMFGNKEVVVPNAAAVHLYHGWKKWLEDFKADFKRNLLEDVEQGKKYVTERQERILLYRDRLIAKTWYNEERKRWEMDPVAVPFAVSAKLVKNVRIRHDWAAMYMKLKGDDKEYYVDTKEFEMLFEDLGGFDGLYLQMRASGVPTVVQLMRVPFAELNPSQTFRVLMRFFYLWSKDLWNTKVISYARRWVTNKTADAMMPVVVPVMEFVIPHELKLKLGMALPDDIDQSVGSSWYSKWSSKTKLTSKSRKGPGYGHFFRFLIACIVYGTLVYNVSRILNKSTRRVLGLGPLRRDPNIRKLRRVKNYFKFKRLAGSRKKRRGGGPDPIYKVFRNMKRVKNPPIRLKDFANIESLRDEINEVVQFLKNPYAFQDIGARAPRGILIVGDRATGKTSLALAIAAEAKVPVVEVKPQQLESRSLVGQSASNVREFFQTARDLAPIIIYIEDFDRFAGVRGKFIHTKKQDHEAFINQLLVELDGFENQDGVVLLATTRNINKIDKALRRPGRMDRIFHLQPLTQIQREAILRTAAKETMDPELINFVDWRKVVEKTDRLRPADLKNVPVALQGNAFKFKNLDPDELMSYCKWFATFGGIVPNWVRKITFVKKISRMLVNHLGLTLTKEDIENVVDWMDAYGIVSNGIELLSPPGEWTREAKFPHAVWTAGRGLLAALLPNFDVVEHIWLEPCSWEGIGCTKITKATNEGSIHGNVESRSYLEKKLVFCFASHVASQLLLPFGEENLLSRRDIKRAQEIATRMVIEYGWGPDDSPTIYYYGKATRALSMGNNCEYEMAIKIEKMYYLAYDKAKEMLQKNRQVLEKIVEVLLEYEAMSGKDLQRIIADSGGIREEEPFFLSNAHNEEPVFRSLLEENRSAAAFLTSAN